MTLQEDILSLATQKGLKLTTAESCTGGMVAAALTDLPGSSAMFEQGFVTYSNTAKMKALGVCAKTLEANGAVSEAVVAEMAAGALRAAQADIAVAISGIAGPGGSEHKPEGRVCFGVADKLGAKTETIEFGPLGRPKIRQNATRHALILLQEVLKKHK